MASNNYFKVVAATPCDEFWEDGHKVKLQRIAWQQFFFFDDRSEQSITEAYAKALDLTHSEGRRISMWGRPDVIGAWNNVRVIGEVLREQT
jgi:hypothetical protein